MIPTLRAQPVWVWAESPVAGSDQRGAAVAADVNGNNFSTGFLKGTVNFGSTTLTSAGGEDIYIAKYDGNGNPVWATAISGSGDEDGHSIALDALGNVYVCGTIGNTVTCTGTPNISVSTYGNKDIFVAKYNPSGQVLWARHAGSTNNDEAFALCTDGTNVYVTGAFEGTATFGALPQLTSSGGQDVFIAAYACASGTEQWAVKGGTSASDRGEGIAVDASGVYVAGYYGNNTCTFQNHSGSLASNGGTDVFLVKYNLSATTGLWKRRAGGTGGDEGTCVTLNGSFVYVGGFFQNTISFYNTGPAVASLATAGAHDSFIAQYDAGTGNYSWVRSESGTGDDRIFGLAAGPNGVVYTTGYWNGTLPFGSGPAVSSGNRDVFATAYSPAGTFLFGMRATGSSEEEGYGVAANASNEVFVTGFYKSSNTQFGTTPQLSNNSDDIFIAKFICSVTTAAAGSDQTICASSCTMNGNAPSSGTGTWTLISGTGTIVSPNQANTTVNGLSVGANVFRWTIVNGGCESFDEVTITRDALPTTASAGPNQQMCSSTATLNGNVPLVGTGTWSLVAGSGTITSPGSANSGVTGLAVGANTFQWSISNGTCPASTDQVVITVDALPTASNAGSDQVVCSSTCTLSGNTPLIGTGTWSVVTGSANVTAASNPNSGVTGLNTGVNRFCWTIANGTCPASRDTVLVQRDSLPSTANAGFNQNLCSSTAFLNAVNPSTGNGVWTLISGSGSIVNPNSDNTTVNGLGTGPNVFQWTVTSGVCPSSSDQVTITVDAMPTPANAGSDQSVCSSTYTLNGNVPVIGTGAWLVVTGSANVTTPSSPNSGATGLSTGINRFCWTIANGTCPVSRDTVLIQRDAMPSAAIAGFDQTLCSSSAFLNAVNPSTGNGLWTLVSGSGTIASPTNDNTTVNALGVGANVFEWTVSNGVCPSSTDQVTINVDAAPTPASAGADQTVCGSSAVMNGNTPLTGTGMWSVLSGNGTLANAGSPSSGVSNLDAGQNAFIWTISNGVCPSSSDTVVIQSDEMPSAASAGNDQTLCSSSANINAINPQTGNGVWTLVSGSGSIVNPNSDNTPVNNLGIGANVFQWTVSNGVCPSSSDSVTITIDEMPTPANAGPDAILCTATHQLNGNTPLVGTGAWSVVLGGGTFTNALLPTTFVNGLPIGLNIFQWTISNGVCPSSSDNVLVSIDLSPTAANAGADRALCSSDDTLTGNFPLSGTGVWSLLSGSGTIQNPSSVVSPVSGLGVGPNEFTWTISNGVCPPSIDTIVITRDDFPSMAVAGPDANSCASSDTLSGTIPQTGTGSWSVIAGGSTLADPSSASSAINDLGVGQNIFVWTVSNGSCPTTQDTVVITYNEFPSLPDAGDDIMACTEQVIMQAQVPQTGSGVWSSVQGGPVLSDTTNPAMVLPALSAGVWYYTWTTQNGFCISSPDTVAITVFAPPSAAIAGDDRITYLRSVELNAVPLDTGIGTWIFVQGSGTFENIHDPFTRVSDLAEGVNILRWTAANGTCPENSDEMRIQVMALIVPEGFSPNGDGVNDVFEITGLHEFQDPALEIFNRWGNQVYVADAYQNNWNGTGQNGEQLPDDVYYYILKPDAENVLTGFIVIKRNTP